MIDERLKIQPGQKRLTPEQQAEAERFVDEWIKTQLATEPVNKQEANAWLARAYRAAGLAPPRRIRWFDSPRHLVAQRFTFNPPGFFLAPKGFKAWEWESTSQRDREHFPIAVSTLHLGYDLVKALGDTLEGSIAGRVWLPVRWQVQKALQESLHPQAYDRLHEIVQASVRAYDESAKLAYYQFFAVYLAPNELEAIAHFNTLVSGYWLEADQALLVQRPRVLCFDAAGNLHSETGKCIEYPDGWGFYAWHGVRVPERVILAPEQLTRKEFFSEPNAEVRRIMQERMGERFMQELGGKLIDAGPRGRLYEVALPYDPERLGRYVQVKDASTSRQYFLRVPLTVQSAAEAVAWTFKLSPAGYEPAKET